jgi:hypothetical protein
MVWIWVGFVPDIFGQAREVSSVKNNINRYIKLLLDNLGLCLCRLWREHAKHYRSNDHAYNYKVDVSVFQARPFSQ